MERNPVILLIVAVVLFVVGTIATALIPSLDPSFRAREEGVTEYSPKELKGKNLYMKEGCWYCHTQQVRPLKWEVDRYGPASKAGEYVYDKPHALGTRRVGPDLARVSRGKKWLREHFHNPKLIVPGSMMPKYTWWSDEEMDAMIAYLQKVGSRAPKRKEAAAGLPADVIYQKTCAACHGDEGEGAIGFGPDLTDDEWEHGGTDGEIFKTISNGIPDSMDQMAEGFKNKLSESEIRSLVKYIKGLSQK